MIKQKLLQLALLAVSIILSACNKSTHSEITDPSISPKYKTAATISFPQYSLDYFFDSPYGTNLLNVNNLSLNVQNTAVNGAYTLYYTMKMNANGAPDFTNASTQNVTFTSGVTSFNLSEDLSLYAPNDRAYLIYIMVRPTVGTQATIRDIYTVAVNKAYEFSGVINNSYGVQINNGNGISLDPLADNTSVIVEFEVDPNVLTIVGGNTYDLVVQIIDDAGGVSSLLYPAIGSLQASMQIPFDLSNLNFSNTATFRAYFALNTTFRVPTALPTVAIAPANITIGIN